MPLCLTHTHAAARNDSNTHSDQPSFIHKVNGVSCFFCITVSRSDHSFSVFKFIIILHYSRKWKKNSNHMHINYAIVSHSPLCRKQAHAYISTEWWMILIDCMWNMKFKCDDLQFFSFFKKTPTPRANGSKTHWQTHFMWLLAVSFYCSIDPKRKCGTHIYGK